MAVPVYHLFLLGTVLYSVATTLHGKMSFHKVDKGNIPEYSLFYNQNVGLHRSLLDCVRTCLRSPGCVQVETERVEGTLHNWRCEMKVVPSYQPELGIVGYYFNEVSCCLFLFHFINLIQSSSYPQPHGPATCMTRPLCLLYVYLEVYHIIISNQIMSGSESTFKVLFGLT